MSNSRRTSSPHIPLFRSLPDPHVDPSQVGEQGWMIQDLLLPTMVLSESALKHNIDLHARWCAAVGVDQAPHIKTHMSPELTRLQLDAGSWAVSTASPHQSRFAAAVGAHRILLAQEVVDRANIRVLAQLLNDYPDLDLMVIVDSLPGVDKLASGLREFGADRRLGVLVELGLAGGRTGARTLSELSDIASEVRARPELELRGIEGYEGVLPAGRNPETFAPVDDFMDQLASATIHLERQKLFADLDEVVLTAGGSVFPDRVAEMVRPKIDKPLRVVVRAGATITHDHGPRSAFAPLAPEAAHELGSLRPALELWAAVVSVPDRGLALANFGKRDTPFDLGLPIVLEVRRGGEPVDSVGIAVTDTNDQHGFLEHDRQLQVGDVLRLGPRHPCTAFDKWPLIPLISDDESVTGAVTTWF